LRGHWFFSFFLVLDQINDLVRMRSRPIWPCISNSQARASRRRSTSEMKR
jgi:hypothetical protein